jgi:hypothetical protein
MISSTLLPALVGTGGCNFSRFDSNPIATEPDRVTSISP